MAIITSDNEFEHERHVQVTNELVPINPYKLAHSTLHNDIWKWLFGTVTTEYETKDFEKITNGSKSKRYGPLPRPTDKNPEFHSTKLTGVIAPEEDLFLHEAYRYLQNLYPDHPDWIELLTQRELNSEFRSTAHLIGFNMNTDFIDKYISYTYMDAANNNIPREQLKSKARLLLTMAQARRFASTESAPRSVLSTVGIRSVVYPVYRYITLQPLAENISLSQEERKINTLTQLYDKEFRGIDWGTSTSSEESSESRILIPAIYPSNTLMELTASLESKSVFETSKNIHSGALNENINLTDSAVELSLDNTSYEVDEAGNVTITEGVVKDIVTLTSATQSSVLKKAIEFYDFSEEALTSLPLSVKGDIINNCSNSYQRDTFYKFFGYFYEYAEERFDHFKAEMYPSYFHSATLVSSDTDKMLSLYNEENNTPDNESRLAKLGFKKGLLFNSQNNLGVNNDVAFVTGFVSGKFTVTLPTAARINSSENIVSGEEYSIGISLKDGTKAVYRCKAVGERYLREGNYVYNTIDFLIKDSPVNICEKIHDGKVCPIDSEYFTTNIIDANFRAAHPKYLDMITEFSEIWTICSKQGFASMDKISLNRLTELRGIHFDTDGDVIYYDEDFNTLYAYSDNAKIKIYNKVEKTTQYDNNGIVLSTNSVVLEKGLESKGNLSSNTSYNDAGRLVKEIVYEESGYKMNSSKPAKYASLTGGLLDAMTSDVSNSRIVTTSYGTLNVANAASVSVATISGSANYTYELSHVDLGGVTYIVIKELGVKGEQTTPSNYTRDSNGWGYDNNLFKDTTLKYNKYEMLLVTFDTSSVLLQQKDEWTAPLAFTTDLFEATLFDSDLSSNIDTNAYAIMVGDVNVADKDHANRIHITSKELQKQLPLVCVGDMVIAPNNNTLHISAVGENYIDVNEDFVSSLNNMSFKVICSYVPRPIAKFDFKKNDMTAFDDCIWPAINWPNTAHAFFPGNLRKDNFLNTNDNTEYVFKATHNSEFVGNNVPAMSVVASNSQQYLDILTDKLLYTSGTRDNDKVLMTAEILEGCLELADPTLYAGANVEVGALITINTDASGNISNLSDTPYTDPSILLKARTLNWESGTVPVSIELGKGVKEELLKVNKTFSKEAFWGDALYDGFDESWRNYSYLSTKVSYRYLWVESGSYKLTTDTVYKSIQDTVFSDVLGEYEVLKAERVGDHQFTLIQCTLKERYSDVEFSGSVHVDVDTSDTSLVAEKANAFVESLGEMGLKSKGVFAVTTENIDGENHIVYPSLDGASLGDYYRVEKDIHIENLDKHDANYGIENEALADTYYSKTIEIDSANVEYNASIERLKITMPKTEFQAIVEKYGVFYKTIKIDTPKKDSVVMKNVGSFTGAVSGDSLVFEFSIETDVEFTEGKYKMTFFPGIVEDDRATSIDIHQGDVLLCSVVPGTSDKMWRHLKLIYSGIYDPADVTPSPFLEGEFNKERLRRSLVRNVIYKYAATSPYLDNLTTPEELIFGDQDDKGILHGILSLHTMYCMSAINYGSSELTKIANVGDFIAFFVDTDSGNTKVPSRTINLVDNGTFLLECGSTTEDTSPAFLDGKYNSINRKHVVQPRFAVVSAFNQYNLSAVTDWSIPAGTKAYEQLQIVSSQIGTIPYVASLVQPNISTPFSNLSKKASAELVIDTKLTAKGIPFNENVRSGSDTDVYVSKGTLDYVDGEVIIRDTSDTDGTEGDFALVFDDNKYFKNILKITCKYTQKELLLDGNSTTVGYFEKLEGVPFPMDKITSYAKVFQVSKSSVRSEYDKNLESSIITDGNRMQALLYGVSDDGKAVLTADSLGRSSLTSRAQLKEDLYLTRAVADESKSALELDQGDLIKLKVIDSDVTTPYALGAAQQDMLYFKNNLVVTGKVTSDDLSRIELDNAEAINAISGGDKLISIYSSDTFSDSNSIELSDDLKIDTRQFLSKDVSMEIPGEGDEVAVVPVKLTVLWDEDSLVMLTSKEMLSTYSKEKDGFIPASSLLLGCDGYDNVTIKIVSVNNIFKYNNHICLDITYKVDNQIYTSCFELKDEGEEGDAIHMGLTQVDRMDANYSSDYIPYGDDENDVNGNPKDNWGNGNRLSTFYARGESLEVYGCMHDFKVKNNGTWSITKTFQKIDTPETLRTYWTENLTYAVFAKAKANLITAIEGLSHAKDITAEWITSIVATLNRITEANFNTSFTSAFTYSMANSAVTITKADASMTYKELLCCVMSYIAITKPNLDTSSYVLDVEVYDKYTVFAMFSGTVMRVLNTDLLNETTIPLSKIDILVGDGLDTITDVDIAEDETRVVFTVGDNVSATPTGIDRNTTDPDLLRIYRAGKNMLCRVKPADNTITQDDPAPNLSSIYEYYLITDDGNASQITDTSYSTHPFGNVDIIGENAAGNVVVKDGSNCLEIGKDITMAIDATDTSVILFTDLTEGNVTLDLATLSAVSHGAVVFNSNIDIATVNLTNGYIYTKTSIASDISGTGHVVIAIYTNQDINNPFQYLQGADANSLIVADTTLKSLAVPTSTLVDDASIANKVYLRNQHAEVTGDTLLKDSGNYPSVADDTQKQLFNYENENVLDMVNGYDATIYLTDINGEFWYSGEEDNKAYNLVAAVGNGITTPTAFIPAPDTKYTLEELKKMSYKASGDDDIDLNASCSKVVVSGKAPYIKLDKEVTLVKVPHASSIDGDNVVIDEFVEDMIGRDNSLTIADFAIDATLTDCRFIKKDGYWYDSLTKCYPTSTPKVVDFIAYPNEYLSCAAKSIQTPQLKIEGDVIKYSDSTLLNMSSDAEGYAKYEHDASLPVKYVKFANKGYGSSRFTEDTDTELPWVTDPDAFTYTNAKNVAGDNILLVGRDGTKTTTVLKVPAYSSFKSLLTALGSSISTEQVVAGSFNKVTGDTKSLVNLVNITDTYAYTRDVEDFAGVADKSYVLTLYVLTENDVVYGINQLNKDKNFVEIGEDLLGTYSPDRVFYCDTFPEITCVQNDGSIIPGDKTMSSGDLWSNGTQNVCVCDRNGKIHKYVKGEVQTEEAKEQADILFTQEPLYYSNKSIFVNKVLLAGSKKNPLATYCKYDFKYSSVTKSLESVLTVKGLVKSNNTYSYSKPTDVSMFTGIERDHIVVKNDALAVETGSINRYAGKLFTDIVKKDPEDVADIIQYYGLSIRTAEYKAATEFDYDLHCLFYFNGFADDSEVASITELGLFDVNHNVVLYATFPPVEFKPSSQHVSFNIIVNEGTNTSLGWKGYKGSID